MERDKVASLVYRTRGGGGIGESVHEAVMRENSWICLRSVSKVLSVHWDACGTEDAGISAQISCRNLISMYVHVSIELFVTHILSYVLVESGYSSFF